MIRRPPRSTLIHSFPTRRSSDLVRASDIEHQPPLFDAQRQAIGAGIAVGVHALRREAILFDQVENGDATLLLDIGIAPDDRALVELDRDDALLVAVGFGHDGAACKGARAKGKGERRVPIPSAQSCRYFPTPRSFPHHSEENTSELQSSMRNLYAVFCLI